MLSKKKPYILPEPKDLCLDFTDLCIFSMLFRGYSAKDIAEVIGVNPSGICMRIKKLDRVAPSKVASSVGSEYHPAVTLQNMRFLERCDEVLQSFYGDDVVFKDAVAVFELRKKYDKITQEDDENNFGRARECGFLGPGD